MVELFDFHFFDVLLTFWIQRYFFIDFTAIKVSFFKNNSDFYSLQIHFFIFLLFSFSGFRCFIFFLFTSNHYTCMSNLVCYFLAILLEQQTVTGVQYACNGLLYNYPYPGCSYPGVAATGSLQGTYYSCLGYLYTYPIATCTYPAVTVAPVATTVAAVATTLPPGTTAPLYQCLGALYTYPYPGCTYPGVVPPTTVYLCMGVYYTYAYPGCAYPATTGK